MKKVFPFIVSITFMILAVFVVFLPIGTVSAEIADGTYNISFGVKEAGNNNTSIAEGYFVKPAKLTVENGQKFIQVTLTNSDYVKSLSGPNGATKVSEDLAKKTVTYKMQVGDLSQPVVLSMHIVLPEEVMPGGYDRQHTARAVFDISDLPAPGKASTSASTDNQGTSGEAVTNPPTGDSTPIALYVILLLSSIVAFVVYRLRFARN